jgi:hypothetical protein
VGAGDHQPAGAVGRAPFARGGSRGLDSQDQGHRDPPKHLRIGLMRAVGPYALPLRREAMEAGWQFDPQPRSPGTALRGHAGGCVLESTQAVDFRRHQRNSKEHHLQDDRRSVGRNGWTSNSARSSGSCTTGRALSHRAIRLRPLSGHQDFRRRMGSVGVARAGGLGRAGHQRAGGPGGTWFRALGNARHDGRLRPQPGARAGAEQRRDRDRGVQARLPATAAAAELLAGMASGREDRGARTLRERIRASTAAIRHHPRAAQRRWLRPERTQGGGDACARGRRSAGLGAHRRGGARRRGRLAVSRAARHARDWCLEAYPTIDGQRAADVYLQWRDRSAGRQPTGRRGCGAARHRGGFRHRTSRRCAPRRWA